MTPHPAFQLSFRIAELLADPGSVPSSWTSRPQWRQSLAHGVPGVALLHIERAAADLAPWEPARAWLRVAADAPVTSGPDSYLYYGAPAVAHALACAAQARPGSYQRALDCLDRIVAADAVRRCEEAQTRIKRGGLASLAEFDTIRGLSGIGSLLVHRDPRGAAIRQVLAYLVRLTEQVEHNGRLLPGWWTAGGPSGQADARFPDGHANTGLAHGIAGPLALLALALRQGVEVEGQRPAIGTILEWLARWRDEHAWPYWITHAQLTGAGRLPLLPQRPSWCYGSAGVARAQQLAALALGDHRLRHEAEHSLAAALLDPPSLAATTDLSACHGFAGLAHIAHRAADDASPRNAARLRSAASLLLDIAQPPGTAPDEQARRLLTTAGPAFLEGATGTALALLAPALGASPTTPWDTCLLTA
ncbi:lanthionine synthetase C family protein [Kitasatospora sp. NBC_01250]|uniref:lanthionine synthetase C family protein n=1 Tax=unclassified Kitasatospora TaxID=2633591 RepID=UPI002E165193|nr:MULTISPECIES: lanthionine synthetase C family protein [unclassified Kitasatospora]WSJ71233.1 lanthionine synthetase C family protein [Kitasatospora sp. NBC_01302]